MPADLVTLLMCCSLLVLCAWQFFTRTAKRRKFVATVNLIPGPPTVPLLGNALQELVPTTRYLAMSTKRLEDYGPIFRTWMASYAEIHLSRPEHVEIILGNTTHIGKALIYRLLRPWLGRGLLTSTGTRWHARRKLITPTFHFKILDTFCDTFVEKSQILADKLEQQMSIHGETGFDVYPFVTRCALDIICQTAMGTDVAAQDEVNSEYVRAVHEISMCIIQRAARPWLHPDFTFNRSSTGNKFHHCLKVLHGFTNKVIQERKAEHENHSMFISSENKEEDSYTGEKKRLAFLDLLLEASKGNPQLSDADIREEVDTFMFEGHDTTTAAATWALFLLGSHPHVQEKVVEELERIFGGSNRPITMRDLNEMKYLERVIKETLRLYPSVPFIGRMAREETTCGGYKIPAGSIIRIQIYHLHRCADQFPNPEVFDPDNFLPERVQRRHPYAFIPFSAGPRNCIGQKFAMLEEKAILATLLRRFALRSVEKRENLTLNNELILRPESGIKLVLRPR